MPGVSNSCSTASPSAISSTASTWRVVAGRSETSPKPASRVNVLSNEVLPALVCPTTASLGISLIGMLQP